MTEKEKLQHAVDVVEKYGSIAEAARQSKIATRTLGGRYNKAREQGFVAGIPIVDPKDDIAIQSKLKKINTGYSELRTKYNKLLEVCECQKDQLDNLNIFDIKSKDICHKKIDNVKQSSKDESTAVLLYSDLHYEETVDPSTINDLNEYNTTIAKQRSNKFFQNSVKLIEMCRNKSNIKTAVLWLGGDIINGFIHDEMMETNSMSPVDACLDVLNLLTSGVDYLLDHGGLSELIIITNVGNHGRTTKERRVATNVSNSYEWFIYNVLISKFLKDERVKFKLTKSYFNYLDIYGYNIRFHHGENVKYNGGVGGISIPLNKAIAQWNQAKHADLDVFGHYHQRMSTRNAVGNGSIVGYNAYAMSIKASFEPPQQSFFLVHPEKGKTVEAPIFVE